MSSYRSLQSDAFDIDGHQCVLPAGHGLHGTMRVQHRSEFDDDVWVWSSRLPQSNDSMSRYR